MYGSGRWGHAMRQATISGFGDAVAEVTDIMERFGYGHCALCLDDLWSVRDRTVFHDRGSHDADSALDWAQCAVLNDECVTRIVLVSAVSGDVREPREDDIAYFGRAVRVFGEHGVDIVDWILHDGDTYRSMAFTVDPDGAWGGLAAHGGTPTGAT